MLTLIWDNGCLYSLQAIKLGCKNTFKIANGKCYATYSMQKVKIFKFIYKNEITILYRKLGNWNWNNYLKKIEIETIYQSIKQLHGILVKL